MGENAHELFAQLPKDASRTISYRELLKQVESVDHSREMKSFVMAAAWDVAKSDAEVAASNLTEGWSFDGNDSESARKALRQLLEEKDVKLSQVFVLMDTSRNSLMSKEEFFTAFREILGFEGPTRIMREIFSAIDSSGDGIIGFEEFNAWLKGRRTMVLERRAAAKKLAFGERCVRSLSNRSCTLCQPQSLSRLLAACRTRAVHVSPAGYRMRTTSNGTPSASALRLSGSSPTRARTQPTSSSDTTSTGTGSESRLPPRPSLQPPCALWPLLAFAACWLTFDHHTSIVSRRDDSLSKKEFLMGMKSLVVDPADPKSIDIWYEVVRSSVTDAFYCMIERERERKQEVRSRGIALKVEEDENTIDYLQFISWLDPKDQLFTKSKHVKLLSDAEKRLKEATGKKKIDAKSAFGDSRHGSSPPLRKSHGGARESRSARGSDAEGGKPPHRRPPPAALHTSRFPRWIETELRRWRSDPGSAGAERLEAFLKYQAIQQQYAEHPEASYSLDAWTCSPPTVGTGSPRLSYPPQWRQSPRKPPPAHDVQAVEVERVAWAATSPPAPPTRSKSLASNPPSPRHPAPFTPTIAPASPRAKRQAPQLQAGHSPQGATSKPTTAPAKHGGVFSPPPPAGWFVEEYAAPLSATPALPSARQQPPGRTADASDPGTASGTASFVRTFPYEWESMLQSRRVAPRFRRVVVRAPPNRPVGGVGYAARYDHSPFKVKQTACSVSMETTRCIGLGVRTKSQLQGFSGPGGAPFSGFNRS